MTTKPKAKKFRIRRAAPLTVSSGSGSGVPVEIEDVIEAPTAEEHAPDTAPEPKADGPALPGWDHDGLSPAQAEMVEEIRQEGLTGHQLRAARRLAEKHSLDFNDDYDAVRVLREAGLDPTQKQAQTPPVPPVVPPVTPAAKAPSQAPGEPALNAPLPQAIPIKPGGGQLPSVERMSPQDRRASEVSRLQKDLVRRRRRRLAMLLVRLNLFVVIPTILVGWYFFRIATPMYETESSFVIQQADSQAAAGLGGLFQGTSMATQQDSITVQNYLTSRAALARLDEDHGYRAHFSQEWIDPIQRLDPQATMESAFDVYSENVRISYDPTEGIVQMRVTAADPETSQRFSEALIAYAEEQVDQMTVRLREDQMAGATQSYEAAEARRADALAALLHIQEEVQQIDPAGETAARVQQISQLESQRQQLQLDLNERLSVARPNQAQVESLQNQIQGIENLIAEVRSEMTAASEGESSLAAKNTELRLAEENYTFQTALVQQALQQMEAAQIEASRQVRYLSVGVEPIAPDEASYPKAFENTLVALLIFAGIYLMLSITASILREQVSS